MKIYLDTSVFGGYYEKEFASWSMKLIKEVLKGNIIAVISNITLRELSVAPLNVQEIANTIVKTNSIFIEQDDEVEKLSGYYLKEKIVSQKYRADTLHIAIATINKVDVLASWNFKHIVHLNKIRLYNSVNLKYGYSILEIRSPREIVK